MQDRGNDDPARGLLDPADGAAFREAAHRALDLALDHMEGRAARPVWQPLSGDLRARFDAPLPPEGLEPAEIVRRIAADILPHDLGNAHPRFYGWVHGAGTHEAVIPALFAAALNANLGGRDHAPILVERQVVRWMAGAFGFPDGAGGLVVSGTSMGTLIALKAARDRAAGPGLRDAGLAGGPRLVGYASAEAHGSVAKAFDILGLGRQALRAVPVDADFRMDVAALKDMVARDRAAGLQPFAVIATAGTVNTGAIDPLGALADAARELGLWLHVDGAFGALAVLDAGLKPRLSGIERADSLAFDFHKWGHVEYDAGLVLLRAGDALLQSFAARPDYLQPAARGLAAGAPWPCEMGPELSRGFRALKVWYQLLRHGPRGLGRAVARNVAQAALLARLVDAEQRLERLAPVPLNIVCFRYRSRKAGTDADALNARIVVELQERGLAAPSTTRIGGRLAIRVNLTNHRTRDDDLQALVADVLRLGAAIEGG